MKQVHEYLIAPDFFGADLDASMAVREELAKSLKDWKDAHPYKPGMVVWTEHIEPDGEKTARKAYISKVIRERYNDEYRAKYKVHLANKIGESFSQRYVWKWEGHIQRGYELKRRELEQLREYIDWILENVA